MKRSASKWFGAVVAALTLTMVASVAPASAANDDGARNTGAVKSPTPSKKDSGWDKP